MPDLPDLPVLRHVAQPPDSGRFEWDTLIQPACDGLVDGSLFLLVQQGDQLLLGSDVAPDGAVGVIEETNDERLLILWRSNDGNPEELFGIETQP